MLSSQNRIKPGSFQVLTRNQFFSTREGTTEHPGPPETLRLAPQSGLRDCEVHRNNSWDFVVCFIFKHMLITQTKDFIMTLSYVHAVVCDLIPLKT